MPSRADNLPPRGRIPVLVSSEQILLPYRIYNEPPAQPEETPIRETIRACLYSRHHSGFERERAITTALASAETFVIPFAVELLGGYPIEIHWKIEEYLDLFWGGAESEVFRSFAHDNPDYILFTRQRAVSYWNAYYRHWGPRIAEPSAFPAIRMLDAMSAGGSPPKTDERTEE